MFLRMWVLVSVAAFRLWPMLAMGLYAHHHPVPRSGWMIAFGLTCVMLLVAHASATRCTGQRLSHSHGLLVVAAAMCTGWMLADALLVPAMLLLVLLLSVPLALSPQAPVRYLALVQWVARNRMQQ